MKKYLLTTVPLLLLVFLPVQAQDLLSSAAFQPVKERLKMASEEHYLSQLESRGRNLETQGLYIESLDGTTVLGDHRSDVGFNPASVIKIATSFAALDKFGPDYHFVTEFRADGEINKTTKTLTGNLVLVSTGDPVISGVEVERMIRQVIKAGVTKVTGSLVWTGRFTYGANLTTPQSIKALEKALKKLGVRITKPTTSGQAAGKTVLASHQSTTLREIVFTQNAYSVNQTAERLGESVGGPKAVEQFLVNGVGVAASEVHIGRTSGLDYNRITPRGTVLLLRHLGLWLSLRNLLPQDIMPMAGLDAGTLRSRLSDYGGAVVGKTGTLPATDGGVSTLAGFLYTQERGVVLFAIMNTGGNVSTYRALQDALLRDLIEECGGANEEVALNGSLRRSSN